MSPHTYKEDHCHEDERQYKQGCWEEFLHTAGVNVIGTTTEGQYGSVSEK